MQAWYRAEDLISYAGAALMCTSSDTFYTCKEKKCHILRNLLTTILYFHFCAPADLYVACLCSHISLDWYALVNIKRKCKGEPHYPVHMKYSAL
jgi:hypothetical protein